jgi:pyruvate,water dikinase
MSSKSVVVGSGIGQGSGTGQILVIQGIKDFGKIKAGDVVVAKYATPDYILILKKIACLVTDAGGVTSHIAIVCRELGANAIIGTGNATSLLKNNDIVSFNVKEGIITIKNK